MTITEVHNGEADAISKKHYDPNGFEKDGLEMIRTVLQAYGYDTYFIIATNSQSYNEASAGNPTETAMIVQGNRDAITAGMIDFLLHIPGAAVQVTHHIMHKMMDVYKRVTVIDLNLKDIFKEGGDKNGG